MSETQNMLHIILNNEIVLEFDRNKTIPEIQLKHLDNMDARMNFGIQLSNELVIPSNQLEKAQFIANSMLNSLLKDDFNQAIAMCTYLGDRIKDLKQVVCVGQDDDKGIQIEFVYDRSVQQKQQEQTIQFFDPKNIKKH